MAAMLHARNNSILFLWDKMFILMQNIFLVPGMQHGRHAKPGICPFKETFEIHDFIKPKKTRQIAHYVYMNELALRGLRFKECFCN